MVYLYFFIFFLFSQFFQNSVRPTTSIYAPITIELQVELPRNLHYCGNTGRYTALAVGVLGKECYTLILG